jgi:hypothetical protein
MKVHIYNLRTKLTKLHIFFLKKIKNIKINAFSIHATTLWFASINIEFILDPYVDATYCKSYMIKLNKSITLELHSIIKKCIANNIDVNTKIQKLGNDFLNAQ